MFNQADFQQYFDQLYNIELGMEMDALELKKIVRQPEARKILDAVVADERRHKEIVADLKKLI